MSEEGTPKDDNPSLTEEKPHDNDDITSIDDLIIKIEGGEDIDLSEHPVVKALKLNNEKMAKELHTIKSELDNTKRQDLVNRLTQAGYNEEELKDYDNATLEATIKLLSTNNDKIIIPRQPQEQPDQRETRPQVMNPETGKFEVHHAYLTPEERKAKE